MKVRAGYEISYNCAQSTPMIAMLSVHQSRLQDLVTPDLLRLDPATPADSYCDGFGNICHVIHAPRGRLTLFTDFLIRDDGQPDDTAPDVEQHALEKLPVETLVYSLAAGIARRIVS
jgi:hypothetical protein